MKLDILGIVAHPDDAELSFGGTLIKHTELGMKTGILDLTAGELGTRGTPEIRKEEANKAAKRLGLSIRNNLKLLDGFFQNSRESQLRVIEQIRKYRPQIVITNATYDRHPDHGRGAALVEESFFKSGLRAISTSFAGKKQDAWRPEKLYFCIQSIYQEPDFFVDISDVIDKKREAIYAFTSQFYNAESNEPETYVSSNNFMKMLEARAREWGMRIGVEYAEGFRVKHAIGVKNLFDLL